MSYLHLFEMPLKAKLYVTYLAVYICVASMFRADHPQDFHGQRLAEILSTILLIVSGVSQPDSASQLASLLSFFSGHQLHRRVHLQRHPPHPLDRPRWNPLHSPYRGSTVADIQQAPGEVARLEWWNNQRGQSACRWGQGGLKEIWYIGYWHGVVYGIYLQRESNKLSNVLMVYPMALST